MLWVILVIKVILAHILTQCSLNCLAFCVFQDSMSSKSLQNVYLFIYLFFNSICVRL